MNPEPLYLANPDGLASLIARDYFQGPNFYQRARTRIAYEIERGQPLTWGARAASVYGAVLVCFVDGGEAIQVTKGKVRWADLAFYGFRRQP